ncbi:hypothetical protein BGZ95_003190 [Linnemannia exigua]|uniref:F-box domain-containing protein n=1 Tax=Linnemannia exigua TaxID=604196 RepID=A0AAD4D6N6_9FUNG|nr:hypothetical protein BGZ95_003190 [Linnemannia exigua]
MSFKSRWQHGKHKQIDKRVPPEIWEQIFSRLYPSQLSKMSMVNKNLNAIVHSLELWPRMFHAAHGPKAQLRTLVCIPRFKSSFMIFMCASSLHVCERCFGLTEYSSDNVYMLPLSIPVLLPRRATDAVKYVGDRFDPNWTIRMCLPCRQGHLTDLEEPIPPHVANRQIGWDTLGDKYPSARRTPEGLQDYEVVQGADLENCHKRINILRGLMIETTEKVKNRLPKLRDEHGTLIAGCEDSDSKEVQVSKEAVEDSCDQYETVLEDMAMTNCDNQSMITGVDNTIDCGDDPSKPGHLLLCKNEPIGVEGDCGNILGIR